ncbi:MAG TPA: uracil-DNA glycosylase [Gallionellaceae bacterium]|nr:uracil-DNA glycosylase [Gallionellaceae bacterium]
MPVSDVESARRREDVLRELNLHPLWQLRVAATTKVPAALPAVAAESVPVPVVRAEQTIASEIPGADIATPIDVPGWPELKQRVKECSACKLRAGCMQTVFGMGDEKADWLFVGSWPTEDDETKGEPFAGQAGQLLDNMLSAIQLKRESNVYLANVVKCCGAIKRGPQAEEIAQCAPYLARQIQLLQPKMIVALGHAAATGLLGEDREWNSLLGNVHEFRGFSKDGSQQAIPLIITHHPAALLLSPQNKAQAWRDLCLARDAMRNLLSGAAQQATEV